MSHRPLVVIEVLGPGHHDRAEAAARLLPGLVGLGSVVVHSTLRPRLAADVEALLDVGADGVVLDGPASTGVFHSVSETAVSDPRASVTGDIVVRLVADSGPCRAEIVHGAADMAARVTAAIVAVGLDD